MTCSPIKCDISHFCSIIDQVLLIYTYLMRVMVHNNIYHVFIVFFPTHLFPIYTETHKKYCAFLFIDLEDNLAVKVIYIVISLSGKIFESYQHISLYTLCLPDKTC